MFSVILLIFFGGPGGTLQVVDCQGLGRGAPASPWFPRGYVAKKGLDYLLGWPILRTMKALSKLQDMARRLLPPFVLFKICPVSFSYQNFGTKWLVIMRGTEQDIESNFNALYNWGATNGSLDYHNTERNVATFWSSKDRLYWAFSNIRLNHCLKTSKGRNTKWKRGGLWSKATDGAWHMINVFMLYTETFLTFEPVDYAKAYTCGRVSAERPDYDGRDLIIFASMTDKEVEKEATKDVDNSETPE